MPSRQVTRDRRQPDVGSRDVAPQAPTLQAASNAPADALSGMPSLDEDDITQVRDRLNGARMYVSRLFDDASSELQSSLEATANGLFSSSVDQAIANLFGYCAGSAVKSLLGGAAKAAGPVAGFLAGWVTADWSKQVSLAVQNTGPKGRMFDADAFFRDYARTWQHVFFETGDRALASDDEAWVRGVAEAMCHVAYHPDETREAMRIGLLIPLLQAADAAGKGADAMGQMNGMYNLRVVYTLEADGGPGSLRQVALPTAAPVEERETLLGLSGVLREVPCQLVSEDRRVIADISVNHSARPGVVDPTARHALERYGSGLGDSRLEAMRLQATGGADAAGRRKAQDQLDGFVAEALDLTWDEILRAVAGRGLGELESDGVEILGRP